MLPLFSAPTPHACACLPCATLSPSLSWASPPYQAYAGKGSKSSFDVHPPDPSSSSSSSFPHYQAHAGKGSKSSFGSDFSIPGKAYLDEVLPHVRPAVPGGGPLSPDAAGPPTAPWVKSDGSGQQGVR